MNLISPNHKKWLSQEIENWQSLGIINELQAQKIDNLYSAKENWISAKGFFYSIFIIFLALSVAGVIAHNWDEVSPTMRLVLAFLLLIMGQISLCRLKNQFTILGSLLHFAGNILSLVIVAQVFQIQGNLHTFLQNLLIISAITWTFNRSASFSLIMQATLFFYLFQAFDDFKENNFLIINLIGIYILLLGAIKKHFTIAFIPSLFLLIYLNSVIEFSIFYRNKELIILTILFSSLYAFGKRFPNLISQTNQTYGFIFLIIATSLLLFEGFNSINFSAIESIFLALFIFALIYFAKIKNPATLGMFLLIPIFLFINILLLKTNDNLLKNMKIISTLVVLILNINNALHKQKRSFLALCTLVLLAFIFYIMLDKHLLESALIFLVAGGIIFALSKILKGVANEA